MKNTLWRGRKRRIKETFRHRVVSYLSSSIIPNSRRGLIRSNSICEWQFQNRGEHLCPIPMEIILFFATFETLLQKCQPSFRRSWNMSVTTCHPDRIDSSNANNEFEPSSRGEAEEHGLPIIPSRTNDIAVKYSWNDGSNFIRFYIIYSASRGKTISTLLR